MVDRILSGSVPTRRMREERERGKGRGKTKKEEKIEKGSLQTAESSTLYYCTNELSMLALWSISTLSPAESGLATLE